MFPVWLTMYVCIFVSTMYFCQTGDDWYGTHASFFVSLNRK